MYYFLYVFCLQMGFSQNVFHVINFPEPAYKNVGSICDFYGGGQGYCEEPSRCPLINDKLRRREVHFQDVRCDLTTQGYTLVCCQDPKLRIPDRIYDISAPEDTNIKDCGIPFIDRRGDIDLRDIYKTNQTAEAFMRSGFTVTPLQVQEDKLLSFEYTNGTFSSMYVEDNGGGFVYPAAVGGVNARRVLAVYMAILGDAHGWFCDGVLINREWILTAAHCFDSGRTPTVVRLGEYDVSNDITTATEFPLDYFILRTVFYPEYKQPSVYHDLALVKISSETPYYREDISPVCLPWGAEATRTLVNQEVTLTGWGALFRYGPSSQILQEVTVTVFDPSVCDRSYSRLGDYNEKFPAGIRAEFSLCAGSEAGGKDACQGDSGGPIVYKDDFGRYTLAGIVSTGYDCGLKEFPGIYVPINEPKYLSWIKQVAF